MHKGTRYRFAEVLLLLALVAVVVARPVGLMAHRQGLLSTIGAGPTALSEEAFVPAGEYIRGCTVDTAGIFCRVHG